MIQINATASEQGRNLLVHHFPVINTIIGAIVLERRTRHDQL